MTKFSAPQQSQLAQIGAFLRDHREKQGKSLEDIAICTYIRPQLLNGLETGDPDVLPEPIFVQGFIRRYAEAMGLNGLELAQQFTVDSIPSTPRPTRPASPTDSATTRITRLTPPPLTDSQTLHSPATPIAIAETSVAPEQPAIAEVAAVSDGDLKAASIPYAGEPVAEPVPAQVTESASQTAEPVDFTTADLADVQVKERPSETSGDPDRSDRNGGGLNSNSFDDGDFNHLNSSDLNGGELNPDELNSSSLNDDSLNDDSLNGDSPQLDPVETPLSSNAHSAPIQFDDDLPEAFTTQAATRVALPTASGIEPVGVEYSGSKSANLTPLIIGGLVAVLAAGAAVLFTLFGGGDRQPGNANSPDAVEQTTGGTGADAVSEVPETTPNEVAAQPPVSTAPVYVEATATSEAWVSIIADGNPTPIFEGTLQPGDTQVWEAQEKLSVYAGDPGALQLSANGAEATVMGEPGQPAEKTFP